MTVNRIDIGPCDTTSVIDPVGQVTLPGNLTVLHDDLKPPIPMSPHAERHQQDDHRRTYAVS